MSTYEIQKKCKEWLVKYYKNEFECEISIEDVDVLWSCKLSNTYKVVISSNVLDGVIVDCTHYILLRHTDYEVYKKHATILSVNTLD